jgi:intracellular sulfur oxidation DsrE/DsrF family protein
MRRTLTPLLTALLLATAPMAHAAKAKPKPVAAAPIVVEEKVVYHVNDSANASAALRNIKNHLAAAPDAKIVVVTHSQGIGFLLSGATDKNGNPYEPTVQELKAQGVDFRVCNNTLKGRKIDPGTVLAEATMVPSGVAEIGRLQAKEGYVYLKP